MQYLNDIIKTRHGFKAAQKLHKFRILCPKLSIRYSNLKRIAKIKYETILIIKLKSFILFISFFKVNNINWNDNAIKKLI